MDANEIEAEAMQLGYDRAKYGVNRQEIDEKGERKACDELRSGKYGHPGLASYAFVSAWLADRDFVRAEDHRCYRRSNSGHWHQVVVSTEPRKPIAHDARPPTRQSTGLAHKAAQRRFALR